jgi:hypothetical protein
MDEEMFEAAWTLGSQDESYNSDGMIDSDLEDEVLRRLHHSHDLDMAVGKLDGEG